VLELKINEISIFKLFLKNLPKFSYELSITVHFSFFCKTWKANQSFISHFLPTPTFTTSSDSTLLDLVPRFIVDVDVEEEEITSTSDSQLFEEQSDF
jgi:hypothetical protein